MQFGDKNLDHMMSDLVLKKFNSCASGMGTYVSKPNELLKRKSIRTEEITMTNGTPPTPPYRQKRPLRTPILSEILNSKNDLLPYVLQFNFKATTDQTIDSVMNKNYQKFELNNFDMEPSLRLDDYFLVEPEITKQIELIGSGNCLFLAVARALLYKLYFENQKYEFIMRNIYFNDVKDQFKFDSDLALQETLRKKLCIYWLSFVQDGKFVENCKYTK